MLRQWRAALAAHKMRTVCLPALLLAHNDLVVLGNVKMMTAVISIETTTTTYTAWFGQRYRFQETLYVHDHIINIRYTVVHHCFGEFGKQTHPEENNLAKHYSVIMATQEIVISVFLKSKFDL